mgnify:CR=1 FL=1
MVSHPSIKVSKPSWFNHCNKHTNVSMCMKSNGCLALWLMYLISVAHVGVLVYSTACSYCFILQWAFTLNLGWYGSAKSFEQLILWICKYVLHQLFPYLFLTNCLHLGWLWVPLPVYQWSLSSMVQRIRGQVLWLLWEPGLFYATSLYSTLWFRIV